MKQKLVIRVTNVDSKITGEDDSVIIFIEIDDALIENINCVVKAINQLDKKDPRLSPEIKISVNAQVYDGTNMDEEIRDGLLEYYEGEMVDQFPEIDEAPISNQVFLEISQPLEKEIYPDSCIVWIVYNHRLDYAAPVRFLGNIAEDLFTKKQNTPVEYGNVIMSPGK
jgi:hypothetical protein